MTTFKR